MEWNDNIWTHEFITENRTSGEVQSLTIKVKAFKKDALGTIAGSDGVSITYNDHTPAIITRTGKNYYDYNNGTVILSKTFTYTIPAENRTSTTITDSDNRTYISKFKLWSEAYLASTEWDTFQESFFTDLEALDVSW
jgi:hypothetical protein